MGNAISAAAANAAAPALCAAVSALQLVNVLDPQHGGGTTAAAQASALRAAVQALLPFAAAGGLMAFLASEAFLFHHLRRAGAAAAAGGGARRLPEHLTFMLCAAVAFLEFLLFVVQAAGGVDHGGAARALSLAALRALPAAATASFYLGMLLFIIGHIRAGGEGGGGAVAGYAPIEGPVALLAKLAVAAAAAVVILMATAICFMFRGLGLPAEFEEYHEKREKVMQVAIEALASSFIFILIISQPRKKTGCCSSQCVTIFLKLHFDHTQP